ncbi:MAG: FCD domain-containing protein [Rhodospirillales bacterium]|nr:FCD domain-containing protein [Rhodospirillales bacterium]
MRQSIKPMRIADAIADHLERLIYEGALRPGERLIGERELAQRLDVSRPSLRDALLLLEQRGLIQTDRQGSRVAEFLRPLTQPLEQLIQSNPDASLDYMEFRSIIESAAAAFAAVRATPLDRESISVILARMERAHGNADPAEEADADAELHAATYEAAHNVIILHVMRAFSEMLRRDVFYSRAQFYGLPGVRDALLDQHRAIGDAILRGDAAAARGAAAAHIAFTRSTLEAARQADARLDVSLRRVGRADLIASARTGDGRPGEGDEVGATQE